MSSFQSSTLLEYCNTKRNWTIIYQQKGDHISVFILSRLIVKLILKGDLQIKLKSMT